MREQVKRNMERFPDDFMFQLTDEEVDFMVSQNAIPPRKRLGGYNPYAFARNGANMLSSVLRSPIAIQRSIQIIRAFTTIEETLSSKQRKPFQSPDVLKKLSTHSRAIMRLFQESKLTKKEVKRVKGIQKEMIALMQRMIFASLGKEEEIF